MTLLNRKVRKYFHKRVKISRKTTVLQKKLMIVQKWQRSSTQQLSKSRLQVQADEEAMIEAWALVDLNLTYR